jgi:hypothetical protein
MAGDDPGAGRPAKIFVQVYHRRHLFWTMSEFYL